MRYWTYRGVHAEYAGSGDGHTWVVAIQCGNGGICADHVECSENGQDGLHATTSTWTAPTSATSACPSKRRTTRSTHRQAGPRASSSASSWPSSELVVQPPGGKTLVNFETNFYTPDHQADRPVRHRRRSVGRDPRAPVVVHATTSATAPARRPQPRAPAPRPRRSPTSTSGPARSRSAWTRPTRASTASGRGSWRRSPTPLTVAGAAQDLEIVEAIPQLVLRVVRSLWSAGWTTATAQTSATCSSQGRSARAARFPPTGRGGASADGRRRRDPQRPHQPRHQQQPDEQAGDRAEAGQAHEGPGASSPEPPRAAVPKSIAA